MRNLQQFIIAFLIFLPSCIELPQPEKESYVSNIPDDRLAFYVISETTQQDLQGKIMVDSIKSFGKRFISYDDIISYDTLYFSMELSENAIKNINSINLNYNNWCLPYAVVCNGKVIFGAYLYHPLSSCFPYWFYSTTARDGDFAIYAPVWTNEPVSPDPRKDPAIIRVLTEDGKIKVRERDQ